MKKLKLFAIYLIMMATLLLSACNPQESSTLTDLQESANTTQQTKETETSQNEEASEDAENPPNDSADDKLPTYGAYYYDLTNVVLYIEVYDELPPNYITKAKARELGWEGGSVEDYMEGAAIGGDYFGNYEGLLPEADGRAYT